MDKFFLWGASYQNLPPGAKGKPPIPDELKEQEIGIILPIQYETKIPKTNVEIFVQDFFNFFERIYLDIYHTITSINIV